MGKFRVLNGKSYQLVVAVVVVGVGASAEVKVPLKILLPIQLVQLSVDRLGAIRHYLNTMLGLLSDTEKTVEQLLLLPSSLSLK